MIPENLVLRGNDISNHQQSKPRSRDKAVKNITAPLLRLKINHRT